MTPKSSKMICNKRNAARDGCWAWLGRTEESSWRWWGKIAAQKESWLQQLLIMAADGCRWGLRLRGLPRKPFARASVLLLQTFWILVLGMLRSMEAKICRHVQIIRIIHESSYYFGAKRFWDANPWVRPWILSFCPIRPMCNIATSNAL